MRALKVANDIDHGVRTTKSALSEAVNKHFVQSGVQSYVLRYEFTLYQIQELLSGNQTTLHTTDG